MFESLRRIMFLGMGAAAMSWDKSRQMIDDLVARGDITADEGKRLYEDLTSRAEEQGRALNDRIRMQIVETLKDMGIADRTQVAMLESRIAALERRINELTITGEVTPEPPVL